MRQIIHNYKLRLTNLSQSNRSLRLGRLSRRRDIDFKELGFLEKDSAEGIIQKIIAGKDIRLISQLDPRHEPTNLADRRLNYIFREVRSLLEETGTYDLYVGYPFVEGKFVNGTIVRCPVLLFPVRLERNLQKRPRWQLKIIKDEAVEFNKTFLLAYEQFQQMALPEAIWEEEIEAGNDWRDWVNSLYQKIKAYDLQVNFNSRLFDLQLESFPDLLKTSMDNFAQGKLIFKPHAVLGIFPQSDSALLQDYEVIEAQPDSFQLDHLFQPEKVAFEHQVEEKYIRQEDRYFVTEVDESQEAALNAIKQGHSLLIHGPPGTGKSQVIVNLIADAMAHGKKVLLVSQKRAALDVVYKRLHALALSRFAVLVHDYRHDKSAIYKKIKQQIDDIDSFKKEIRDLNITKWEYDFKLNSRQADQYYRLFTELFEALTQRNRFGMSVHELYLQTDAQVEPLPLKEMARQWDVAQLDQFCQQLAGIMDYADFYDPNYPWYHRLPFRHYTYEDKQKIAATIADIPVKIKDLHRNYLGLQQSLGDDLLDIGQNKQWLAAFLNIQNKLAKGIIREDIEAIHQDELSASSIKQKLGQIEKILLEMENLYILKAFPWRLFSNLDEHVQYYDKIQDKATRFFSLKFYQARWFVKKLLDQASLKLDDFPALKKEYKLFSRLHWHYVRIHEKAFFEDFPLMDDLAAKQSWLERKRIHLKAFQLVQGNQLFPQIKPKFVFGKLDEQHWQRSQQVMQTFDAFTRQLEQSVSKWNRFLHTQQIAQLQSGIHTSNGAASFIEALQATLASDFEEIQQLDRLLADCSPAALEAIDRIKIHFTTTTSEDLLSQVKQSVYYYWIEQSEQQHPVLTELSTRGWPRKRKDYAAKLADCRKMVTELIQRRLKEEITGIIQYNRLRNPITYRNIYHQVSKKRRLWPVRKLVKESWQSGLATLVPCWMASPESAAAIFPMEKDFFDLVIFDEASQCFVERALPVVLRGKQTVIAGDEKQLQPSNLYAVRFEDREEAFAEHELAMEVESILDLAKTSIMSRKLNWHYRSREEELINFSNQAFYEGKLQVMPAAEIEQSFAPPLSWVSVQGHWQQNRNRPEAERVIALILEWAQHPAKPSIGVVTFNYHQQELIKDLLDETIERLAQEDEMLLSHLQAAMRKSEQEEYVGLFIKNIENVQGDERDLIIFSLGYGYTSDGKLHAQFGLLNQQGGANRLNVAISRAKRKIIVVSSFDPADLQVDHLLNEGPKLFKDYLLYVKAISEGRTADAHSLLEQQNEATYLSTNRNLLADTIAARLEEKGYYILRDLGDTRYKLDIAVKASAESKTYLLGIECEGSHYFSGPDAKAREIYRPASLRKRGWKVHRVWARNFWKDAEKEMDKILQLLASK